MKRKWRAAALLVAAATQAGAQSGGQAEVAAQGFYLHNGAQLASETTGAVVKFEEFLPGVGLFRGNLEAYSTNDGIQPADNFIQLRGAVWLGLRWNATGGDFRNPGSLFHSPFTNLIFPEMNARGFDVEAGDSKHGYALFFGRTTVLGGPRIPFRITMPQTVAGASFWRSFGNLETGVRLLRFAKTEGDPSTPAWYPPGRDFRFADNLTFYSTYNFSDHLQWYSEATGARAAMVDGTSPGQALSYFFGPSWDSERVTIRANYANLGRSYYPLAGYWTGDRKGPFGEVRLRPLSRLEIFASGSEYRSTAQPQDNLPILKSTTLPVGASLTLPWQMTASAQWSTGSFTSFDPGTNASQRSDNRQWTATLSRPIQRHSLRFMARDMRLVINGISSRERSGEFEDTFQAGHFAVSGALRVQRAVATDDRNSLYARASAQWSSGRVTASGFFERGKDLANQTVFATSTTNSTVLNVSVRATREWAVQAEAFRTRLLSQLNPDSLFVQSGQSLATNALLSRFQQWTFLFRVGRTFHWGSAKPGVGLDQYTAEHMPIKGWVEGAVYVPTTQGRVPAPEVVVRLETGQFAVTDAAGWYRFTDIPEGGHVVSIDVESLPADFNPGQAVAAPATVGARKVARADFEVYRLGSFSGRVNAVGLGPESVEGIVIRLTPGGVYTMTDKDGAYAFHNVREGAYQATVDELTLPDGTELTGGGTAPVIVRYGGEAAGPVFEMQRRKAPEKPVRKMFETVIPIKIGN